jgi:signal transduction histidine kinase
MEVETVKFISEQISPILDLLASRRQREWQVSVIKHDLEIPITMISDTIQKLASRGQISESSGYAKDDILVACKLLSQLTSQLSFEASQILVHKQPTRLLGDIIARSIQMLRHFASQDNDMKIEYTGIDEIPALMIDPILTERVIHNLVMNAVKYGTEGTTIRLTGGKNDVCYYVDIENFGIGITENEAQHLFRRYFRSARAKKRRHGVGIGLYMAKTIMELQKCSLVLKQLDNPTVFRVSFPRSAMMK